MMLESLIGVLQVALIAHLVVMLSNAAWHKLSNVQAFSIVLDQYQILPIALVGLFAWLVPATEILLAIALLVPASHSMSVLGVMLLLGLYSLLMTVTLMRGMRLKDCGCNGAAAASPVGRWPIARNLAMIALLLIVGPVNVLWQSIEWGQLILMALTSLLLIVFYNTLEQLFANNDRRLLVEAHYG